MADLKPRYRRLRDHIHPGVLVLFVGINPGLRSAATGHHFAGYSNRFWKLLYESQLVDELLTYDEDHRLPEWGLGLTNIISRCSAGSEALDPVEYRRGLMTLKRKIRQYRPHIVAFLGVTIFRMVFTAKEDATGLHSLGPTTRRLAGVPIFLLPNPSGRNAHYSYGSMLAAFQALRDAMKRPYNEGPSRTSHSSHRP